MSKELRTQHENNRILLMIAVWKRPDVTRICYRGVQRLEGLFAYYGYNLIPFIVYSEDEHQELAQEFGFHHAFAENHPLGAKLNTGLEAAFDMKWDYLMQLGSDDLMTAGAVNSIVEHLNTGYDFFGFDEMLVADLDRRRMKHCKIPCVIGAGRVTSREIVEKAAMVIPVRQLAGEAGPHGRFAKGSIGVTLKPSIHQEVIGEKVVQLWPPEINIGLDTASETNIMRRAKRMPHVIRLASPGIIDLKTGINIHKYDDLKGDPVEWHAATPEIQHL